MPLYLLRVGCWFRFQTALYEVVEYLGVPPDWPTRVTRARLVGTNQTYQVNADATVQVAEEGPH